MAYLAMIS